MSRIETINGLIAAVLAKVDELAEGQTFTQYNPHKEPPEYNKVALNTYAHDLPVEDRKAQSPLPFPHLVARKQKNGRTSDGFGRVVIRLFGGVYNEDEAGGYADQERLENIVMQLPEVQDFEGWSLSGDLDCEPPDKSGNQAHPKYVFYADLVFDRDASFEN